MSNEHDNNDDREVLERNVAELLRRAHQPPQIAGEARARILARLEETLDERAEPEPEPEPERRGFFARLWATPRRAALVAGFAVTATAAAGAMLLLGGGDDSAGFEVAEHANRELAPRRVELADGSVAVLRSGAEIIERAPRDVELIGGDVLFDVVPGRGRFVIRPAGRPGDRVVVLGTRFLVSAGDDSTLAAVIRGRVKLVGSGGELELGAGEGGELTDGGPKRRPVKRLSHLTSWAKGARVRSEGKDIEPARRGNLIARFPNWGDQDYPLPVRDLTVDVHVENQVARVAVDQTFFNEQAFQLEGVYQFALPPGAAISRLAMYVEGKLMEAGLAERVRARQVYESIVYRRRDPALMEWMAGNQFKVRIFPLPGRQEKRILLSYTQPLERLYDDVKLSVPLPRLDRPIGELNIRARLTECARPPVCEVASTSHPIQTAVDGADLLVTYSGSSVEVADDLLLTIRQPRAKPSVSIQEAPFGHYLIARIKPALSSDQPSVRARRRWVIVDDTSASREPLERAAQVHIADRLLAEIDERDEVAVLAFDSTVRKMDGGGFTAVANIDAKEVHDFLDSESKDGVGATDLGAALSAAVELLDGAVAAGYEPYIVYLGDGLVTGGTRSTEKLAAIVRGKAAFIGLAIGAKQDSAVLGRLAAETGGAAWTLDPGDDLDWSVFDLVAALNTERVTQLEAELIGGGAPAGATGAEPVYLSTRQLADGEELVVIARTGAELPSAIEIEGRRAGDRWSHKIALADAAIDRRAGYLPRLWAQEHIAALLADEGGDHKKAIVDLAMKHWLLTPHTSLLVLENDEAYKRFEVTRSSGQGWAAYQVPAEIEVVSEPLTAAALSKVSARAMIFREPLQLFQQYDAGVTLVGGLDGVAVGGGGFGVALGGEATETSRASFLPTRLAERERDEDANRPVAAAEPVTEEKQKSRDKTVADEITVSSRGVMQEQRGFEARLGPVATGQTALRRSANKRRKVRRGSRIGGGTIGRGRGGYYRYHVAPATPVPIALHYSSDPRFEDLTALIDGIYSGELDRERARLLRAGDGGERRPVSDRARRLLERARELAAGRRYTGGELVADVGEGGTFRIVRTTAFGLREELRYDGEVMTTHYPDLGLALRREIGDIEPWLLEAELPILAPEPAALSRFYSLTAESAGVVARPAEGDWSLLYRIDDRGRFAGIERRGAESGELLSIAYDGDDAIVRAGGEPLRLSVRTLPAVLPPERAGELTVEMPLRHPEYWSAALDDQGAPRSSWAQLLASHAALGDRAALQQAVTDMIERGQTLSPAELVLASGGVVLLDDKLFAKAVTGDHPVAGYLRAARRFRQSYKASHFDRIARDDSWLGLLAGYRQALHLAQDYSSVAGFRRAFKRLVDRGLPVVPRYIAAYRANGYQLYRDPEAMVALWDRVATDGPWRAAAASMAAMALVRAGRHERAASRYQSLIEESLAEGRLPPLDYNVRNAFLSGPRGQAGWTAFWSQVRERAIDSGDADLIVGMLRAAMTMGQQRDVERLTTAALDLDLDGEIRLDLIAELLRYGRRAEAGLLFQPLWNSVADGSAGDPDVYAWAADFREQEGRFMEAARHYDKHLELLAAETSSLAQIRAELARLLDLYGRAARLSSADRAAALARVRDVAGRWRAIDPDNPDIDRRVSAVMFAVGRDTEAMRYLMTAIERHSMEGSAYNTVATALQTEGRVAEAAGLWDRAAEIEPDNPTWALSAARARLALGDRAAAKERLDAIVAGKKDWHERFAWIVSQAETLRKQLIQ